MKNKNWAFVRILKDQNGNTISTQTGRITYTCLACRWDGGSSTGISAIVRHLSGAQRTARCMKVTQNICGRLGISLPTGIPLPIIYLPAVQWYDIVAVSSHCPLYIYLNHDVLYCFSEFTAVQYHTICALNHSGNSNPNLWASANGIHCTYTSIGSGIV